MDDREKISRCMNAPWISSKGYYHCKVYGRTVGYCRDCAFSVFSRPEYLRKMGIIE